METPIATGEMWSLFVTEGGDLVAIEETDCGERYHTTEQLRSTASATPAAGLSANEVIRRFVANTDLDTTEQELYQAALDAMNSRE